MEGSLAKRLLLAAVLVSFTSYTVIFSPKWFYLFVVELFLLVGMYEYFQLMSAKKILLNRKICFALAAAFPLSDQLAPDSLFIPGVILCLLLTQFSQEDFSQAVKTVSFSLFGLLWIAWLFSFFMKLHSVAHGVSWVFYTIFVVKMGDSAGYFVGRAFGKTKFTPYLSPQKTWEGAIAEFATCLICSVGSKIYLPHAPMSHLVALGAILGIASQLGDLAESLVKRDVGSKDSGFIPGLGGILDVIDSLLFTVPIVYYYASLPGISE